MTPILSSLFSRPPILSSLSSLVVIDPVDHQALSEEIESAEGQALLAKSHAVVVPCSADTPLEVALLDVLPIKKAKRACRFAPVGMIPESVREGKDPLWARAYLARFSKSTIVVYVDCANASREDPLEDRVAEAHLLQSLSGGRVKVLLHGTTQETVRELLEEVGLFGSGDL